MSGAGHILPTLTTPVCQCDPAWPGATPTNVWVAKKLYNIKTCVGEEGRGGTFKDIVLSIRMAWPYMVWPGLTWWAWHMLPPASEFYDCIWTWTQMDNELGASGECPLLGLCLENTNYIYIYQCCFQQQRHIYPCRCHIKQYGPSLLDIDCNMPPPNINISLN